MKHRLGIVLALGLGSAWAAPQPSNGIALMETYPNWRVIGVSHRSDSDTLRIITGNAVAIRTARKGRVTDWPDGAVLAKMVWKDTTHPKFPAATVPGELVHIEIMVRDREQFKETGGWGFARWVGDELKPLNNDGGKPCFECHKAAADTQFVFTRPVAMPY